MAIRQTEVDGVATLVALGAGPTVAGLTFRVGRADETLAGSGVTHMLEHLALFPLGLTDYHYNGTTGATLTTFHTSGGADDVVTFFDKVCDGLRSPPVQRLEAERSVIRTEWENRAPSVYAPLQLWRYGARSYGIMGYDEPGIYRITPDEIGEWSRTWFTRDNAVLWIAGDVPAGLRLPLPDGRRMPVPEPTNALPVTPAFFAQGDNFVAIEAIVQRSPAVTIFAEVVERALFRDLRQEGGLSYSSRASSEPRGDGYTTVVAAVDALPERVDAALGGFVDTLAKLRIGRIDQQDITSCLARVDDLATHPEAEASLLESAAFDLLTGSPVRGLDELRADLHAVTLADVHRVAVQASASALLMVPDGRRADWAGFAPAPTESTEVVTGARFTSLVSDRLSLHVASDGVTRLLDDQPTTVHFRETAALLRWPDGARRLVGNDGFIVHIEPTLWRLGPAALAPIDAAIPAHQVITMPSRDADAIPRPSAPTAAPATRPAGRRGWSTRELVGLIAAFVVTGMFFCLAGMFTLAAAVEDPAADDAIGWVPAVVTWGCTSVLLAPVIVLLVRRRRRYQGR